MRALRLDRVEMNVRDLDQALAFYAGALGFVAGQIREADRDLALLLGVRSARSVAMRRGSQTIALAQTEPPGAPYPAGSAGNDAWFQHCALVTSDMRGAYLRLGGFGAEPISTGGPQILPGGVVAYKFCDPDGHPLELIGFPDPDPRTLGGIDHSAIAVADAERSVAFYAGLLGLTVAHAQVNTGPAQDALDGLDGTLVDVVALCPAEPAPHLELLGYRRPAGRTRPDAAWSDLAASRLVFVVDAEAGAGSAGARVGDELRRDPDGHAIRLEAAPAVRSSARGD